MSFLSVTADIDSFIWNKTTKGYELGVHRKSAPIVQFLGFAGKVRT
jgi:hypothetical protein